MGVDPSAFSSGDQAPLVDEEGALIDPNDPNAVRRPVGGDAKDAYYQGVMERLMAARGYRNNTESRYGK